MKNRYLGALALAGIVSLAACGNKDEAASDTMVQDTTAVAPVTPAPVVMDSTGAMPMDSSAAAPGAATDTTHAKM
jgi:hypothetical protein